MNSFFFFFFFENTTSSLSVSSGITPDKARILQVSLFLGFNGRYSHPMALSFYYLILEDMLN